LTDAALHAAVVLVLVSSQVFAWSDAGHKIVASIEAALKGKVKVNDSLDPPTKPEETMNVVQTIRLSRAMV